MYNMLFLVIVNGVILKVYLCGWLLNILFKSSPSKSILPVPPSIQCKFNRRKKLKRKFYTLFVFCLFVCFLFFRVCRGACNLSWGVFSGAPWLRKFGNLSIRENLLRRQRTTERWPYRLCGRGRGVRSQPVWGGVWNGWGEMFAFQAPRSFITWPPGRLKKKNKSFSPLNFNVHINLDNRKRARARNE